MSKDVAAAKKWKVVIGEFGIAFALLLEVALFSSLSPYFLLQIIY